MDREKEIFGASDHTDEVKEASNFEGGTNAESKIGEENSDKEELKPTEIENPVEISSDHSDMKDTEKEPDPAENNVQLKSAATETDEEKTMPVNDTSSSIGTDEDQNDSQSTASTTDENVESGNTISNSDREKSSPSTNSPASQDESKETPVRNDQDENEIDEDDHSEHDDHHDHHEEDSKVDYSSYDKKQLVAIVEGLLKETEIRKIDRILKEVKPHFDELREAERAEALHRFVENGGDAADFVMKNDPLDNRFDADYALLKERKSKHYSSIEKQKDANLVAKNNLLEKLRNLVDDEETTISINALKEIQKEWKSIGQIPAGQVKSLWANYNALIDRYYDNRSIYFELKELDRRKNLEIKLDIVERAERLSEEGNIKKAIKDLNDLHEEFRHVGPVPKDDQEALWQRFKAASDVLYDKRRVFVDKLKEDLNANLKIKKALGDEAQAFLSFDSDRINEWNEKTKEILELQKRWEAAGGLPREKAKEINKHFWGGFKGFFSNKNAFFKKLEGQREENLKKKEELVARAEELKESKDFDKTAETLKALQNEWREIGPVPEKQKNAVFVKFKKACDYFFDQKRAKNKEVNKEFEENLKNKEGICATLEQLTKDKNFDIDKLESLFDQYQALGFVPKNSIRSIQNRFNESVDNFLDAAENLSEEEKHNIKLTIKFTKLKNSPNSNRKLYHKEGEIRKSINQIENDIALWRNNLEFFANSKTADKLKDDFNQKINKAKEELKELEDQLQIIRNI